MRSVSRTPPPNVRAATRISAVRDNGGVRSPSFAALVTAWTWQPVAIAAAALLAVWYAHRAVRPTRWPRRKIALFTVGLAALVWTTCGFAGAYLDSLFWVWTAQQLALLLVVPYLLLAGGTLRLGVRVRRLLDTRFVRVYSPESEWYKLVKPFIEKNFSYWINTFKEDGYWNPNFSWGVDSGIARNVTEIWKCYISVKRARIFKTFEYIS